MKRPWQSLLAASLVLLGCRDPVNDDRIAALGGEDPNVERGPLHRPGQPCTVCHSAAGGRHPEFSLAGTVFKGPDSLDGAGGITVQVIDESGAQKYFTTNSVGNFYADAKDWSPSYPLWTAIACTVGNGAYGHATMQTQIFRATSCADCHSDPPGPSSVGHIYMSATGVCR